jgi:hypothetical protein
MWIKFRNEPAVENRLRAVDYGDISVSLRNSIVFCVDNLGDILWILCGKLRFEKRISSVFHRDFHRWKNSRTEKSLGCGKLRGNSGYLRHDV